MDCIDTTVEISAEMAKRIGQVARDRDLTSVQEIGFRDHEQLATAARDLQEGRMVSSRMYGHGGSTLTSLYEASQHMPEETQSRRIVTIDVLRDAGLF